MESKLEQELDDYAYRVYITDGFYNLLGCYNCRYVDLINTDENEESADEIIQRTLEMGGLHFKE